jgi:hypothetical protein
MLCGLCLTKIPSCGLVNRAFGKKLKIDEQADFEVLRSRIPKAEQGPVGAWLVERAEGAIPLVSLSACQPAQPAVLVDYVTV